MSQMKLPYPSQCEGKMGSSVVSRIHEYLIPIVIGERPNSLIVRFQRLCGVEKDGSTRNKPLKFYFKAASACGEEIFSLMPLMIWFAYPIAPSFITNFAGLLMSGQILKDVFKLPRPSSEGTGILKLGDQHFETEYGFPSTHTLSGYLPVSVVLCLMRHGTKIGSVTWAFCFIYVASVALSRLYLGVHSVADILAGLLLGLLVTFSLHYTSDKYFDEVVYRRTESIFIIIFTVFIFLLCYPRPRPWRAGFGTSAQILGSWVGSAVSMWYIHTIDSGNIENILLKNSFIKETVDFHFDYEWNFNSQSIYILLVSLFTIGVSKYLVKYLAVKLFVLLAARFSQLKPHPLEERDSLGYEVPIHKAYFVEVPVRYSRTLSH